MFKHPNVVPITAEKIDSKQQSKEETIPPSRTGTALQIAIRQLLAACHNHGTHVLENPRHRALIARTRREDPLHAPDAAATTAATHSPAFPIAAAEICKGTHSRFPAHKPLFCPSEKSFPIL
jgi:hypothetical protein